MTRLFRSKSCGVGLLTSTTTSHDLECTPKSPTPSLYLTNEEEEEDDDEEEDEYFLDNPITTPFIGTHYHHGNEQERRSPNNNQLPQILSSVASALRKSLLVTCSVVETSRDDFSSSSSSSSSMEIGCPTDARHVSHVTFDRFNGCFLGLPIELQPQLPRKVPSARLVALSLFQSSLLRIQTNFVSS